MAGDTEDVATLSIRVTEDGVDKAKRDLDSIADHGEKAESRLLSLKAMAITTGIALAGMIGRKVIEESIESQAATAQLEASIKSTGGAAGLSRKELLGMAEDIQKVSTFGDDAATKMHSLLLTFTNIRGDVFREASSAVVDLATKMGGDLNGAAIQVGKALNDPIKGITALQRVGVSFSDSQKKVIEDLVNTGRGAEAQRMILAELRAEFGGSAEAARNTLGGALEHLKNNWGDLFEVTREGSGGMIVAINAIADALPHVRDAIGQFVTNTVVGANNIWAAFSKVNNILSFDLTKGWGAEVERIKALNRSVEEERRAMNALATTTNEHTDSLARNSAAANFNTSEHDKAAEKLRKEREERERHAIAATAQNEAMVRQARQQYEAIGLTGQASAEARAEANRTNALLDLEAQTRERLVGATKAQAAAIREEAEARRRAIENVHTWEVAGAQKQGRVDREEEARKEAEKQAERQMEENTRRVRRMSKEASDIIYSALDALGKKGANVFQQWWDAGKQSVNRFLADTLGNMVGEKWGEMIGIGPGAAAKQQVTAGATMLSAAQMQLQAAQIMAMAGPGAFGGVGGSGGVADASVIMGKQPTTAGMAMGYGGIVAGGALTGYNVASSLYSTSHGAVGNYARGAIGGGLAGAAAGAAIGSVVPGIGTAVGAVVGGAAGVIGGLLGIGSASKEAARAMAEAQKTVADNMAALRAEVKGDDMAAQIAQVEADREQRRRAIEEAYQGGGANSDTVRRRNELLRELNQLEDERIRQLREEAQVMDSRQIEDYQARRDAATPGNEEEEARRAFVRQQQREREDLIRSFGSEIDATEKRKLAALDEAQAAELAAAAAKGFADAVDGASASVRNAPSGMWLPQYLREFADRGTPAPRNPMVPSDRPMFQTATTTGTATTSSAAQVSKSVTMNFPGNIVVQVPPTKAAPVELARGVAEGLRIWADSLGINLTLAETLEQMPTGPV